MIGMRALPTPPKPTAVDALLLEKWALFYLGRYSSSTENLRRVLQRRVRRRFGWDDKEVLTAADTLIDVLVARYRETHLLDDASYAAARARRDLARGRPLHRIAAGLSAKGVGAAETAAAVAMLRDSGTDPNLAAAVVFARRRRLGPFRTRPTERARELAAFARAGFDRATADCILSCADADAVAALVSDI